MILFRRELSRREKFLLTILSLLLLVLLYMRLVDARVRTETEEANEKISDLEMDVQISEQQLAAVKKMQKELNDISGSAAVSYMPSYNAEKDEVEFLNRTLSEASDYYIGFSDVSKDGELVRRNFSLQYAAPNYASAKDILKELEKSKIRCLIGDFSVISVGESDNAMADPVEVSCTATFYETMHDGDPDPQLKEAEESVSDNNSENNTDINNNSE